MRIRLGYAALSKTLKDFTTSRTLTYTNYLKMDEDKRLEIINQKIIANFKALEEIIKYNIKNNFHFYRLTSKLIPLATKSDVKFDYLKKYQKYYTKIGNLINKSKMRVDTHPDQYCVLNSVNKETLSNTISILKFQQNMLESFNIKEPKLVLHVGSNAFGKVNSIARFKNNFKKLDPKIQNMIIIENDDKVFNIQDVLRLCKDLKIPMVLDYHHFMCNNNGEKISLYIKDIFDTWNNQKLNPKVHFSSPKSKLKKEFRSHHEYINVDDFINFIEQIKFINRDFDIMIEAKMKDDALSRLVRELKYKTNYKFIDETTFEVT